MFNRTQDLPHNGRTPVVFVLGQFAPTKTLYAVCYEWLHTKCIGMPNSEYQRLSASDEGWRCNRCHRTAFPFHDCSAISNSSTNDSLWVPTNSSRNASDPTASLISSNRYSIYYSNCRSLAPKLDHLQAIAALVAPTVIAACETWL